MKIAQAPNNSFNVVQGGTMRATTRRSTCGANYVETLRT